MPNVIIFLSSLKINFHTTVREAYLLSLACTIFDFPSTAGNVTCVDPPWAMGNAMQLVCHTLLTIKETDNQNFQLTLGGATAAITPVFAVPRDSSQP